MYLAVLALSVLFQQSGALPFSPDHSGHRLVNLDTVIRVQEGSAGSAFTELAAIGFDNHIPIGIVLGGAKGSDICGTTLDLKPGEMTVAELIATIRARMPGYQADLKRGVLDISPTPLPDHAAAFLGLSIGHFHSDPEPLSLLGRNLWPHIRGVIAPGEGTDMSGLFSLSAERVEGMDVANETVESILNRIVDKGNAGMWILKASKLKALSSETAMPYEIYGYVGEDRSLAVNLTCGR